MTSVSLNSTTLNADIDELPEGWTVASLGRVTQVVSNIKPAKEPNRVFRYVDIGAVDNGTNRIAGTRNVQGKDAPSRARRPIRPNDVLFSNVRTYLRNMALVTEVDHADVCSTGFTVLRSNGAALPSFLFCAALRDSFIDAVTKTQTGTHYPATSEAKVRAASIPLPPLSEQVRIVEAIERLTARVDSARQRLGNVPKILKRFRETILAAACTGRLTEAWREGHAGTRSAVEQLAEFESAHARLRSSSAGTRAAKAEATLELDGLPDLPSTWCYRSADSIVDPATVISYGIVLPGPEVERGIPYVRQQDVIDGTVLVDQLRRTTPEIAAKHQRSTLVTGDVLLCIIRHLRVAIVPPGIDGANLTQGTVRLRPARVASGPYLAMYLGGIHAQNWMRQRHFGMSMPRINVRDARALPVAVPPVQEQAEIVQRVQSLMKLANAIERRVVAATARADKITQAVLAKAFRGELVPTEAELARAEGRRYESAVDLLARINSRVESVPKVRRRKQRTSR